MKLLVDLGNTRVKAALWDGRELRALGAAVHAGAGDEVDFDALWTKAAALAGKSAIAAAVVASVAGPALEQRLAASVRARIGLVPRFVASGAGACGVRNAYAAPERLGVDRFLGLVALHAAQAAPAVLANCGTALTLDALAADGTHLGGLIAPSPALMLDALTGAAARLSRPQSARIVEIADNTADAMQSGAWLAAAALVERFAAHAGARLGGAPALVLSGGGANTLAPLLGCPHRIDADIVLRGLAVYADSHAE